MVALSTSPCSASRSQVLMVSSKQSGQRAPFERRHEGRDRCSDWGSRRWWRVARRYGGRTIRGRADAILSSSPTPSRLRRAAEPIRNAGVSISRRGFTGRAIVPRLRGKCAHGRSRNAGAPVDIRPGASIGARREMPLGYMALASHSRSGKHGCNDHGSRN
jgi:hypothetical protein